LPQNRGLFLKTKKNTILKNDDINYKSTINSQLTKQVLRSVKGIATSILKSNYKKVIGEGVGSQYFHTDMGSEPPPRLPRAQV
jgi:hypothetical protein